MRIFLIRHGQSLGNVDDTVYSKMQDFAVPLTPQGWAEAESAGKFLKKYYDDRPELKNNKLRVFYSPYCRTTETKDGVLKGLGSERIESVREEFLLREQEFGVFSDIPNEKIQKKKFPAEFKKYAACQKSSGKFYARPPLGESRADVALRVRVFKETLMRDVSNGQEDFLLVSHGVTNRAFEMDFLHKGVEWFEKEPNPGNCDIILIEGDRKNGYTATKIYQGMMPQSTPRVKKHFSK